MKDAVISREELKQACLDALAERALEHPAGHQGKLVARYVLCARSGERVGVMFEKSKQTKPHLWVERRFLSDFVAADVERCVYLASSLYRPAVDGGKPVYGRHAALKAMRELANADLVRFTLTSSAQMETILDHLAKQ